MSLTQRRWLYAAFVSTLLVGGAAQDNPRLQTLSAWSAALVGGIALTDTLKKITN